MKTRSVRHRTPFVAAVLAAALTLAACREPPFVPANVDAARLGTAAQDGADWLSHGRGWDEQRHSPLTRINAGNVLSLKLAWHHDLGAGAAGLAATPLVIDGVLYTTSPAGAVHALEARSGRELWRFEPRLAAADPAGTGPCCAPLRRGLAAWRGRLFHATPDGRLVALDAASGRIAWETPVVESSADLVVTSPPRTLKDKVVIGTGGSTGVGGHLSAYDAETGRLAWRFVGVPGDTPVGAAWVSVAYDPQLALLYAGAVSAAPLAAPSVVALRPDSGALAWHHRPDADSPPDAAPDTTSTRQMVLADVGIRGRPRRVLLQAGAGGRLLVLDRATGEAIQGRRWHDGPGTATLLQAPAYGAATGYLYFPVQAGLDPAVQAGLLVAWDPVAQREVWRSPLDQPLSGGALATAGNLVFQGTPAGELVAWRATDGKRLWSAPARAGIIAAPVSYSVEGEQFVAVEAALPFAAEAGATDGVPAQAAAEGRATVPRLLVYSLEGRDALPEDAPMAAGSARRRLPAPVVPAAPTASPPAP